MQNFYPDTGFELTDAYSFGFNVATALDPQTRGTGSGYPHDYGVLAQAVFNSGDGDYIEIGSLFGASAIVVAKTKERFGIGGAVCCLDPLNGYYRPGAEANGLVPSPEILMANAEKHGVGDRIECVAKRSFPFPEELAGRRFSCGFIDGDHWGESPLQDWNSLRNRVSEYIIFDNYDLTEKHVAVRQATDVAMNDKDWTVVHISSISFVLRRTDAI